MLRCFGAFAALACSLVLGSAVPLAADGLYVDEASLNVSYSGVGWDLAGPVRAFHGGLAKHSAGPGDNVTIRFEGTSATLVSYTGPGAGIIEWTLDDNAKSGVIDLYSREWTPGAEFMIAEGIPPGEHTLVLSVADTKNNLSSGNEVFFDALKVDAPQVTVTQATGASQIRWIRAPSSDAERQAFRRTLTAKSKPTLAWLLITADSGYELFVNGEKVGADSADGKQTVEKYDLSPYIAKGKNAIVVSASNPGGIPSVLAVGCAWYPDGTRSVILGAEGWSVGDWTGPECSGKDFDDSAWPGARGFAAAGEMPFRLVKFSPEEVMEQLKGGLRAEVSIAKPGHLFEQGEPVQAIVSVHNPGDAARLKLETRVYDWKTNVIAEETQDITLDASSTFTKAIEVQPKILGYHTVEAKVLAGEGTLAEARDSFGVLASEPDDYFDKSQFGVMLRPGDLPAVALLHSLGFGWAKIAAEWNGRPDQGFPPALDPVVEAVHGAGLKLAVLLTCSPNVPADSVSGFAGFAGRVAEHLKGKAVAYEILEEANVGWIPFARTAIEYTSMLNTVAGAVNKADPTADIIIGGMASGFAGWDAYTEDVIKMARADGFDGVAVEGFGWGDYEKVEDAGRAATIWLEQRQLKKAVWVGACGAPQAPAGRIDHFEWTPMMQAMGSVKSATAALGGRAEPIFLWRLVDDPSSDEVSALGGLFNADLSPKMSCLAVAYLTTECAGSSSTAKLRFGIKSPAYLQARGESGVVIHWSSGEDDSKAAFGLKTLRTYSDDVRVADMMGNSYAAKPKSEIMWMEVTEEPLYVLDCGFDLFHPFAPPRR
jgi:hypothetical protein